MRLVRVKAPEGMALQLTQLAFEQGVLQVSVHQQKTLSRDGREQIKDVVDIETAAPTAKAFLDSLMTAAFFTPDTAAKGTRSAEGSKVRITAVPLDNDPLLNAGAWALAGRQRRHAANVKLDLSCRRDGGQQRQDESCGRACAESVDKRLQNGTGRL